MEETQIPKGWIAVELGKLVQPSKAKMQPPDNDEVRYVGLEHIEKSKGRLNGFGNSAEVRSTKSKFEKGSLLYGKLRPYLNKVWLAEFDGICSTDILVFPASEAVDNRFLLYRFLSSDFVEHANLNVSGVQHPRVHFKKLSQFLVHLPPLNEQRRIVAKIEELFTKLDAGVEALKTVQALLKRYRQSVLKAAVEGKLTQSWRKEHAGRIEPASELLKRILAERRTRWEADYLTKMKAKGKVPKDDRWKAKYNEPEGPDVSELPNLPGGWVWTRVEQLCFLDVGFAFKSSEFTDRGVPLLRGDNIQPGSMRWKNTRFWPEKKLRGFEHLLVKEGDIILAMDRPLISAGLKIARAKSADVPSLLVQRMARFRLLEPQIAGYLYMALQTEGFIRHLLGGQTGTQLPHVSGGGISSFVLPLPPLAEQSRISELAELMGSVVDDSMRTVALESLRNQRLRQAILKKAFEGRLVPQDPNDEPASALLEQIRTGRKDQPQHWRLPLDVH